MSVLVTTSNDFKPSVHSSDRVENQAILAHCTLLRKFANEQAFISMLLLCLLLSCTVASLAINAGLDSTAASKFWRSKARDEFAFKVDKGIAKQLL